MRRILAYHCDLLHLESVLLSKAGFLEDYRSFFYVRTAFPSDLLPRNSLH